MDAHVRKMLALYGGVLLGAAWLVVALLAHYKEGFVLFGAFQDLGVLFWVVFTALGVALVGTLAWASLGDRDAHVHALLAAERAQDPVQRAPGFDPRLAPGQERTTCARCGRTLPVWRMPEGTCTVCAPFSVFLDPPRKDRAPSAADAELERRRNRLFILQGLGLGLLALAFVSAVYVFPVLRTERPVLATVGFLVFSPLLFGLILLMYAHSEAVPEQDA